MGKERDYIIHDDNNIKGFFGDYRWLSNYYLIDIEYDGLIYPSTEHAYQAAKFTDIIIRKEFINLSCLDARLKGQSNKPRDNWNDMKYSVMYDVILYKFKHVDLKNKLLKTGSKYLEETNHWNDTYYGICNNIGENNLGKILMKIREEIK